MSHHSLAGHIPETGSPPGICVCGWFSGVGDKGERAARKASEVWFHVQENTLNIVSQNVNSRKTANTEGQEWLPVGSSSCPYRTPSLSFLPPGSQSQRLQASRQASLGSSQPPYGVCMSVPPLVQAGLPAWPWAPVPLETPDSSTLGLGPRRNPAHPTPTLTGLPGRTVLLNYFKNVSCSLPLLQGSKICQGKEQIFHLGMSHSPDSR